MCASGAGAGAGTGADPIADPSVHASVDASTVPAPLGARTAFKTDSVDSVAEADSDCEADGGVEFDFDTAVDDSAASSGSYSTSTVNIHTHHPAFFGAKEDLAFSMMMHYCGWRCSTVQQALELSKPPYFTVLKITTDVVDDSGPPALSAVPQVHVQDTELPAVVTRWFGPGSDGLTERALCAIMHAQLRKSPAELSIQLLNHQLKVEVHS